LKRANRRESWPELEKFFGAAKVHVSDERLHEIREEVMKELIKKRAIKN
jgi:hypothetical protein